MGHFIAGALCLANQCTLDLLEDDLKASQGKCHGAVLHALSEQAMSNECSKMKETAPDATTILLLSLIETMTITYGRFFLTLP